METGYIGCDKNKLKMIFIHNKRKSYQKDLKENIKETLDFAFSRSSLYFRILDKRSSGISSNVET